ncbi:MAG: hypothetical protein H6865_08025 [Rhodospirillales bacterium]|nr:hypothetical protein [Alphaproteobacteria bacterium]MCB9987563.1 hypothetical protein [Rhodospirillales bacterium]USO07716.1 MAG: hypothetical protein H6866_00325 [Rhodospirillales bacterium]
MQAGAVDTGQTAADAARLERVAEKIQDLLALVEDMCRGGKPAQFPPQLYTLLENMWADELLAEAPSSYVYLPGETETPELTQQKGVTSVNPIPLELLIRKQNIDAAAASEGIYNYRVLGLDPHYRRLSGAGRSYDFIDPAEQAENVGALIWTRGDLHVLRQGLHMLYAKLTRDGRVVHTPLIIQNSVNGFWNPLFEYLGVAADDSMLRDHGVRVTRYPGGNDIDAETDETTLHVLKSLGQRMALPPQTREGALRIAPGDTLYVASGSPHKALETKEVLRALHASIWVQSLNAHLGTKPQEAEEVSFSYEGNNIEKMRSVISRIQEIGYDKVCRDLCPAGKGPENVWLTFDDRGFEFVDRRILETDAFADVRNLMNPYLAKSGPGSELAILLKTIAKKRFFTEILAKAIREIEEKFGETPDTTIIDTGCHITVRLDQILDPNPAYIATFAKVRSRALTAPQPSHDHHGRPIQALQTDHFLAPVAFNRNNTSPGNIRTKAQIPNYIPVNSEVAGSLRMLCALTGVDEHAKYISDHRMAFNVAAHHDEYAIGTLHTLFPHIKGHGTPHLQRSLRGPLNGSFYLMTGQDGRYDMAQYAEQRTRSPYERADRGHTAQIGDALGRLRDFYQDADGFLLTDDHHSLKGVAGLKWLKTLLYYSLLVGKQVDDRAIKTKYLGVLDGTRSWTEQEAIFDHLARTPLLGNRHADLIDKCTTKSNFRESLVGFRSNYVRPEILDKRTVNKPDQIMADPDLYRVTIYCSATLGEQTAACKEARRFSFDLARNGFAIINGGGREGLMVATSEGAHDFRRWWQHNHPHAPMPRNHVTSYQCHDTYEREGGWHEDNDFARIFPTIEERMANLMNTDAEILMAGGGGSIQEISASLLMREWGLVPTVNRPLVIVNQVIDGIPVFNALIAMMGTDERKRLNVHVVDNIEQAMQVLADSRAAMARTQEPGKIYIPASENLPPPQHAAHRRPKAA